MNKNLNETISLIEELKPLVANSTDDIVFCVPSINILKAVELLKGTNIKVGAQNMYFEDAGAYTGEISAAMLKSANVEYVILGHSERREYFAETDEQINKKIKKLLNMI